MNTRDYKQCGAGEYYHIYNRGNAKDNIFLDEADFQFFLLRLKQNLGLEKKVNRHFRPLSPDSFSIIAYCLMPNHFHLLVKQNLDVPTGKLLSKLCTSYSMYFNKKYDRIGHVFQDQFKQKNIQNDMYLLWLSAYIHLNPVWAGIVKNANQYQWSSVRDYLCAGGGVAKIVKPEIILGQIAMNSYKDFLIEAQKIGEEKFDLEFDSGFVVETPVKDAP